MPAESVHRLVFLLAGFLLVLTSTAMSAQPPYNPGVEFPMIEIAIGESARVNALNQGTRSSTENSSCTVTIQFLDAQGKLVKQTVVVLRPGNVASLALSRGELPRDNPRGEVRAVLLFGYYGGAPPGPEILEHFDCNIVPSLQVFDDRTGKMKRVLTDAKPLPPPATPAQ